MAEEEAVDVAGGGGEALDDGGEGRAGDGDLGENLATFAVGGGDDGGGHGDRAGNLSLRWGRRYRSQTPWVSVHFATPLMHIHNVNLKLA